MSLWCRVRSSCLLTLLCYLKKWLRVTSTCKSQDSVQPPTQKQYFVVPKPASMLKRLSCAMHNAISNFSSVLLLVCSVTVILLFHWWILPTLLLFSDPECTDPDASPLCLVLLLPSDKEEYLHVLSVFSFWLTTVLALHRKQLICLS